MLFAREFSRPLFYTSPLAKLKITTYEITILLSIKFKIQEHFPSCVFQMFETWT